LATLIEKQNVHYNFYDFHTLLLRNIEAILINVSLIDTNRWGQFHAKNSAKRKKNRSSQQRFFCAVRNLLTQNTFCCNIINSLEKKAIFNNGNRKLLTKYQCICCAKVY